MSIATARLSRPLAYWRASLEQKENPAKLRFTLKPSPAARLNGFTQTQERPEDIAHMVRATHEMDDRGFTPELSIFVTNPRN
jgi:hypothetical protein